VVIFEYNKRVPESTFGGRLLVRYRVAGDFDAVRLELAALSKEALPGDPVISKL